MNTTLLLRALTLCALCLAAASLALGFIQVFGGRDFEDDVPRSRYIVSYEFDDIRRSVSDYMTLELNTTQDTGRLGVTAGGGIRALSNRWYVYYRNSCGVGYYVSDSHQSLCNPRNPISGFSLAQTILEWEETWRPWAVRYPRNEGFRSIHVAVEVDVDPVSDTSLDVTDEESTRVQDLTDSINEDVTNWAAQDILDTTAPFSALCVAIGFMFLACLGLIYVVFVVNHGTLTVYCLLALLGLGAAISFTVSRVTVEGLVQDRVGTHNIFPGRIDGATVTVTESGQFFTLSTVSVILSWLCLAIVGSLIGVRIWLGKASSGKMAQ